MMYTIIKNAAVFDGVSEKLLEGHAIVLEEGIIRDVAPQDTLSAVRRRSGGSWDRHGRGGD